MAMFEIWKEQYVFAASIFLIFVIYCGSSDSRQHCVWLNDTNSSCEMCEFKLKEGTLNCSNRAINTTVTFNVSNEIIGLDVSHNQLNDSPSILVCPKLEWIDLSYNIQLKVVKRETFKKMRCAYLKIINMNHCGILQVAPGPIEQLPRNLGILLIADNSLSSFDVSLLQRLKYFKVLDIRGNSINQDTSLCKLMEQSVTVLMDGPSNCNGCEQIENFCQTYDLTYQLSFCQENAGGIKHTESFHCLESTTVITTSGLVTNTPDSTPFSKYVVRIVRIASSCTVFVVVVLVLFITFKFRKCWKRRRRQNQYNRWLAVYTPPESVCTYQKRVSFSGEIVIKESGENITKKKLNSDEFKKCRQFDISLLIRTQSLPPQLREEGDERPIRVVSWI